MPSSPRPKQFVASRDFVYARRIYRQGDPVTDRWTVDRLVKYGTRFIRHHKPAPAETPVPPVESEPVSPEED